MSLSVYGRGLSANSLNIIMATNRLIWLARPSRKRPEAQKETDRPPKTRKCRFNSFCMVVAVVDRIQAVFLRNLSFRSYTSLESALIVQTTQNVRDGQTDSKTNHITPVPQLRAGLLQVQCSFASTIVVCYDIAREIDTMN